MREVELRFCIFSDVHGNLEALEAIFRDVAREDPGYDTIFLGDAVGYGPNPNACVDLIRKRARVSLLGNHDQAAISEVDISNFNPYAKSAIVWTRENITAENKEFLRGLPYRTDEGPWSFVHATPCEPERCHYLFTLHDARLNFDCFRSQVCFIGHSHQPLCVMKKPDGHFLVEASTRIEIQEGWRYIINDGSVGQPRDGDPKASYAFFDSDTGVVEIRRIDYDYATTQRKMEDAGLPKYLIQRLQFGH
jgi:diadenosine tetraphosphatase ApaH/serine/threonine PP2A family protein phosphatase